MQPYRVAYNRTKIIATVGPSSHAKETLKSLIKEGVDVFRMNFSHGDQKEHQKVVDKVRALNRELGTHVALLVDLQGPKIRIDEVEENTYVKAGQTLILTTRPQKGNSNVLSIPYPNLTKEVKKGDRILVDDGKIELRLTDTNSQELSAKVVHGGKLSSRKGINLPDSKVSISSLTSEDRHNVQFAIRNNVEWIALSFVRTSHDVDTLKDILRKHKAETHVIAKIEKPEAVKNIDAIISKADGIMVARGDLGVEIWMGEVPIIQKKIIEKCNKATKPVIVATQMMESMVNSPSPTRAETNDVANAVMDGADALMLSAETAVGKYPLEVIKSMMRTINSVEKQAAIYYRFQEADPSSPIFIHDSLILVATKLAKDVKAKAIVGMTMSGYTAYKSSAQRPHANIFVFTGNKHILNTMSLVWGVRTYLYEKHTTTDDTIKDVEDMLKNDGHLRKGDVFISLASMPIHAQGRTNMIKINQVK